MRDIRPAALGTRDEIGGFERDLLAEFALTSRQWLTTTASELFH